MVNSFWGTVFLAHSVNDVNLMVKDVTRIKTEITLVIGLSVKIWKNMVCLKKISFGILLHVVVKMVNIIDD